MEAGRIHGKCEVEKLIDSLVSSVQLPPDRGNQGTAMQRFNRECPKPIQCDDLGSEHISVAAPNPWRSGN